MDGFRGKEVCELWPKEPLEASLSIHSTEHTHACHPHILWSGRHPLLRLPHLIIALLTRKCEAGFKQRYHVWPFYTCVLGPWLRIPQNIPKLRVNTAITETNLVCIRLPSNSGLFTWLTIDLDTCEYTSSSLKNDTESWFSFYEIREE